MIRADSLAGTNVKTGNGNALVTSLDRLFEVPSATKAEFPRKVRKAPYQTLREAVLQRDRWRGQHLRSLGELYPLGDDVSRT